MWRANTRPRVSHQLTIANDSPPNSGLTWILYPPRHCATLNPNPYEKTNEVSTDAKRQVLLMVTAKSDVRMFRCIALTVFPCVMLISWLLRGALWYGFPALWFYIGNPIAILATIFSISLLHARDDRRFANLALCCFIVLILLSFVPIWFRHSVLEPGGSDIHWHNYWGMTHIH